MSAEVRPMGETDGIVNGLMLEMRVFRADSEQHATRIARSVIGKALRDIPLEVKGVSEI
jgi:uncharacterized protein (UPF0212 family)